MDFSDFLKHVPKIKQEKLLAEQAHLKMVPAERILEVERKKNFSNKPRKAAVLMLIYPKTNKSHLALIVRNTYPGVHSAQIGFPGGKVELEDDSLTQTALRETHEEIGIHPEKIEVIKSFTEVYIPPSNFIVAPFLGISYSELEFVEQEEEVAGIIEFPLLDFLNEKTIVNKFMNTSYGKNIEVPTFKINDHYVWGATAMMMSELKEVLLSSFKN
ncbi:MAG: CoA pyrophosphatase [Flavobacteriaceae bacterium]|jgi:8-oxo-dGTP pyrophosphatase MutT (NUDIX family)|nr:CoA pyrophosphatase [Flavobacteriaceae bacterium]